jgi:hypothetical protein
MVARVTHESGTTTAAGSLSSGDSRDLAERACRRWRRDESPASGLLPSGRLAESPASRPHPSSSTFRQIRRNVIANGNETVGPAGGRVPAHQAGRQRQSLKPTGRWCQPVAPLLSGEREAVPGGLGGIAGISGARAFPEVDHRSGAGPLTMRRKGAEREIRESAVAYDRLCPTPSARLAVHENDRSAG